MSSKISFLRNIYFNVIVKLMVKGYVTTKEAADRLGVTPARIRRMILDGVIQGAETSGRDRLIPEKEMLRVEALDRKAGRPAKADK